MKHIDEEETALPPLHERHHLNIHDFETWLNTQCHKLYHSVHVIAHCAYFVAVYVEGHGFYAFMGGALFIITIYGYYTQLGD
jgi:hypothetical protein